MADFKRFDIGAKEAREIEFWENDPHERPGAKSARHIVSKLGDAAILFHKLSRWRNAFAGAATCLEIGAGQGWTSCILKREFPKATVHASDIAPAALASVPQWERIFDCRLDETFVARSYDVPKPDGSYDLIWCFAAAHHFVRHRRTLGELKRLLAPGGKILYLYEPTCSRLLYPLAHWRVNRIRPNPPEDVLVIPELRRLARESGLHCETRFDPTTIKRRPIPLIYYSVLARLPVLARVLPASMDFCFSRADPGTP